MPNLHDDLNALSLQDEPPSKKKLPLRLLLVGLVIVIAIVTLVLVYLQVSRRPIAVRLAEATLKTRWSQDVVLIATGHVEPKARAVAAALAPGRVKTILVQQGQRLNKNDIVADLDRAVSEAQLKEAKIALGAAKARVGAQRKALALAKKHKKDDEIDVATSALAAAYAGVKAQDARIAALKLVLQNSRVASPIAGTIWKLHATVGQSLAEGALAIADVTDLSTLYIDTDVSESKLGAVGVGMNADVVFDAFPGRHFDASVIELRPEVNKDTATGVVRLALKEASPEVLLNMAARVSFLKRVVPLDQRRAAARVTVPASAVTERDGAACVFVFTPSGAAKMPVQKGEALGSDVEIASGLKAGERVVLAPPDDLDDGRALELLP